MAWSENNVCVRCNGGGDLLTCSECQLVVHEGCMKCSAEIDDLGNFRCPHCFFKQCVTELSQARKNVKLTRKALSIFLGERTEHNNEDNEAEAETERVRQSKTGAANVGTSAGHCTKSEEGIGDEERVNKGEDTGNVEGEKIQAEGSETPLASTDQTLKGNSETYDESTEKSGEETEDEKIQEEKSETPLTSTDHTRTYEGSTDKSEDQEIRSKDKDVIGEEDCENSSDPTGGHRSTGHLKAKRRILISDSSCEDYHVRKRHGKQSDRIEQSSPATHSAEETSKSSGEEFDDSGSDSSKWIHPKRPSVKLDNNIRIKQPRRVLWTEEEVKMLKAGVEKFSSPAKKNLPWIKILNFGRQVFHKIRTSEDLREKWRRMT